MFRYVSVGGSWFYRFVKERKKGDTNKQRRVVSRVECPFLIEVEMDANHHRIHHRHNHHHCHCRLERQRYRHWPPLLVNPSHHPERLNTVPPCLDFCPSRYALRTSAKSRRAEEKKRRREGGPHVGEAPGIDHGSFSARRITHVSFSFPSAPSPAASSMVASLAPSPAPPDASPGSCCFDASIAIYADTTHTGRGGQGRDTGHE